MIVTLQRHPNGVDALLVLPEEFCAWWVPGRYVQIELDDARNAIIILDLGGSDGVETYLAEFNGEEEPR